MTYEQPIIVETTTITCEGKGETSGHPKVALSIDARTGEARCPYCSQTFRLDPQAKLSAGH